ncbi:MAG: pirin family protein [Burkholderiales bacterium]
MIVVRKSGERGHAMHGWLESYHSFSFADYFDPEQMGYGDLRVINDDRVAPGQGFGTHPHNNMEIISYVLEGELAHKDSMGNASTIKRGDVQRMSAGTGVMHSEFNPSGADPVHFLQIWILPDAKGLAPGYEQKHFAIEEKLNRLRLVASKTGREGSVSLNQDTDVYAAQLDKAAVSHESGIGRIAYLHVAQGNIDLNGIALSTGDGAKISGEDEIRLEGSGEILLFDLKG